MTKTTKTHIVAIAILAGLGLGAPVASVLANAPAHAGLAHRGPAASAKVEQAQPAKITLAEVVITADAPRRVKPAAKRQAAVEDRCYNHVLEQEGRPGAATVRVCIPAS